MKFSHSRIQHGVGQGSFHSATVSVKEPGGREQRFDYVYDCGTLDGIDLIKRASRRLDLAIREGSTAPVIDALVISHYDFDHLNGAELLTKRYEVKRLFLPYLGVEELVVILCAQAHSQSFSKTAAEELSRLAHGGGTLFGVPVTFIEPGPPSDEQPDERPEPSARDGMPPQEDDSHPMSLNVSVGPNRRVLGGALACGDDVQLSAQSGDELWRLRFWNRGLDFDLVVLILSELDACGFPLSKMEVDAEFSSAVHWIIRNKPKVVAAYQRAVQAYKPDWAREAAGCSLANFISIAMYAGPPLGHAKRAFHYARFFSNGCKSRMVEGPWRPWRGSWSVAGIGWLGTGEAPLGEPSVWADFESHFARELPETLTVLIPHHGAAPRTGPRFYNRGLNMAANVSVVSAGKTNRYGHPMTSVIKQVLAEASELVVVSEDTVLGFQEVIWRWG